MSKLLHVESFFDVTPRRALSLACTQRNGAAEEGVEAANVLIEIDIVGCQGERTELEAGDQAQTAALNHRIGQ